MRFASSAADPDVCQLKHAVTVDLQAVWQRQGATHMRGRPEAVAEQVRVQAAALPVPVLCAAHLRSSSSITASRQAECLKRCQSDRGPSSLQRCQSAEIRAAALPASVLRAPALAHSNHFHHIGWHVPIFKGCRPRYFPCGCAPSSAAGATHLGGAVLGFCNASTS